MSARVALVTGGTRGIGLATCARLSRDGWTVVAVARKEPTGALPEGVSFASCDVADVQAVRTLVDSRPELASGLDLLVNNAGIAGTNPLDADASDELWHAILATNLHGTYFFCKAALPKLRVRRGRVVNVASVLALRGVPDQTAYCAAKHGVLGFTRALARAVAPDGVTVNAVCPGWVDTGMARQRFEELGLTEREATQDVPTGRMTTPDEVAGLIAFLAGDDAANLTGQALTVDGGWLS